MSVGRSSGKSIRERAEQRDTTAGVGRPAAGRTRSGATLSAVYLALLTGTAAAEEKVPVITITNQRAGVLLPLRDEIVATESFSADAIGKTGATMLTEALDKKPGIAVQVECSICNVRNVVLNNLPGRYTTLLIDGIPIFSSVSTAYGLDSVSLGGLERIDIARGAGTSLIAPEALAGAVNIVTRRPRENEFKLSQQFGNHGQANTEWFGAVAGESGALTANYNRSRHDTVDADGNGVSEYSGFRRNLGGLGFFVDDIAGFRLRGRLDLVDEKRMGGAMGHDYAEVRADTDGNPFDWRRGPHGSPSRNGWVAVDGFAATGGDIPPGGIRPYGDGRAGMSEIIFTDRTQAVASATRRLGEGSLRLALGYARHEQDSFYEKAIYRAGQDQYYVELSTQQSLGDTLATVGINYRYEDLRSRGSDAAGRSNDGIDDYTYRTPGLFFQIYHPFFDGRLEANGSLRLDRHNVFGNIASPRLNLLWRHDRQLNSRISLGKGFRAPTSFFEQDHGILDTTRIIRHLSEPETSENLSYVLAYAADRLAWSGGVHWNRIKNMAMLDSSAVDPATGEAITLFTSATHPVTVATADFTMTYKVLPQMETTLGLEANRYRFDPGTLAFARPERRLYLTLDYERGPLDLLARATWTGPQDLARFYDYANHPRYNFDGTRKMDRSPSFWVVDFRAEYKFDRRWSGFAGIDNLFDFRQADKESMLWVDGHGAIDVTQIWGPNRGRLVYGGIKVTL